MDSDEVPTVIGSDGPELEPRPRVVGPGRRERAYLERISSLQSQRAADQSQRAADQAQRAADQAQRAADQAQRAAIESRLERIANELSASERVERGCQKHIDRLEKRLDDERSRTEKSEAVQKRLLVALGALQRENELLRARLAELPGAPTPSVVRARPALRERT